VNGAVGPELVAQLNDLYRFLAGLMIGAIIGSFMANIVTRWPRGKSVMRGRSRCESCGKTLRAAELVPLLSSLVQRGRCRGCGAKIDPVHSFVEAGAALICGLCMLAFPLPAAIIFTIGGWLLLMLAVLDARHFWLPDMFTLPLAAIGLTLGDWVLPATFQERVVGAAIGAGGLFLIAMSYRRLRGKDGLGLGDAKLLGAIGAWLGWQMLPLILLVASGTALLWLLFRHLRGETLGAGTRVPLGTFFAIAVVPAWFAGLWMGL